VDALHGLSRHLVDDEGHVRICLHVVVFRTSAHVEPGDIDGAERRVVRESQGFELREPVRRHGGQVATGLTGKESHFDVTKGHE
jgi:hypothetical protein